MAKEFKEKTITVNLRYAFTKPETKRARASMQIVKKAVEKETRKKNLKISNGVNELLWSRGLKKSLRKITVKIIAEKDSTKVMLPNEKVQVKTEKKETKTGEKKGEATKEKKDTKSEKKTVEEKEKKVEATEKKVEIKKESPVEKAPVKEVE